MEDKTRTRGNKNMNLEHGKLPPQAVDLEEAVLGALMLEKSALQSVKKILKTETFYKESHQKIYDSILDLDINDDEIDILTVTQKLKSKGELESIGGPYYITQLTNRVASAAHIESHCMILLQQELKRKQIQLGSEIVTQGYDETIDCITTNEHISMRVQELLNTLEHHESRTNVDIIKTVTKKIEEAKKTKGITGIESGFKGIDNVTSGWQDSDLIYIAARPSMGKTALVLNMARNMAIQGKKNIAVFSLEMSSEQLMMRLISSETKIPLKKLQRGDMDSNEWNIYHKNITPLIESGLNIFDDINSFEGFKSKCIELHMNGQLDGIVVDYLQLMEYARFKNSREREISEISRGMKLLAKKLHVPLICLSQLSREVEKRPDKKPRLSDLRDSGSIEQDADIVMFLMRPSYYNMDDAPANLGLAMIQKHRNGDLATIKLNFKGDLVQFSDWESESNQFPGDDIPF